MALLLFFIGIMAVIWIAGFLPRMSLAAAMMGLLVLGAVFGPEFWTARVAGIPFTLDRIGSLIAIVVAVICFLRQRKIEPTRLLPIDGVLLLMACVLVVSTLAHDWRHDNNMPLSRLIFFQLIPLGWYFVARMLPLNSRALIHVAWIGLGFGVYLGLTGLFERIQWHPAVFPRYIVTSSDTEFFGRARGPFLNPIGNGVVLIYCLASTVFLWQVVASRVRPILLFALGMIGIGILCTMTRSVWLAALFSVGIVGWYGVPRPSRGLLIAGMATATIVIGLVWGPQLNRFKRDTDVSVEEMAQSASLRPVLAAVAVDMATDKPFFGHGFGQYETASTDYHYNEKWGMPLQKARPYVQHNVFLAALVETGLIGTALLVLAWGYFAWAGIQLMGRRRQDSVFASLGLTGFLFVLAMSINGMFHDISLIVTIGSFFYFVSGLVVSSWNCERLNESGAERQ